MFYLPVGFLLFVALILLLPFVLFGLTLDIVEVAVAKLGFSPSVAFALLVAIVIGGMINIPLYERESTIMVIPQDLSELWLRQFWGIPLQKVQQKTVVALNVGGGLIPIVLALYEMTRGHLIPILLTTAIVTVVSYFSAHVVPGIGIQMNAMIAPLTAVLSAWLLTAAAAPPVAFAGGVLGTLIGADLLHLKEIERMSPGVMSIGGAGVFDGIALCGLFALLLT
jgi:uncharacterized membrane protein